MARSRRTTVHDEARQGLAARPAFPAAIRRALTSTSSSGRIASRAARALLDEARDLAIGRGARPDRHAVTTTATSAASADARQHQEP